MRRSVDVQRSAMTAQAPRHHDWWIDRMECTTTHLRGSGLAVRLNNGRNVRPMPFVNSPQKIVLPEDHCFAQAPEGGIDRLREHFCNSVFHCLLVRWAGRGRGGGEEVKRRWVADENDKEGRERKRKKKKERRREKERERARERERERDGPDLLVAYSGKFCPTELDGARPEVRKSFAERVAFLSNLHRLENTCKLELA